MWRWKKYLRWLWKNGFCYIKKDKNNNNNWNIDLVPHWIVSLFKILKDIVSNIFYLEIKTDHNNRVRNIFVTYNNTSIISKIKNSCYFNNHICWYFYTCKHNLFDVFASWISFMPFANNRWSNFQDQQEVIEALEWFNPFNYYWN